MKGLVLAGNAHMPLSLGNHLVYQEHADYGDIMSCYFGVPINIVNTLFILETQREDALIACFCE